MSSGWAPSKSRAMGINQEWVKSGNREQIQRKKRGMLAGGESGWAPSLLRLSLPFSHPTMHPSRPHSLGLEPEASAALGNVFQVKSLIHTPHSELEPGDQAQIVLNQPSTESYGAKPPEKEYLGWHLSDLTYKIGHCYHLSRNCN